MFTIYNEGDPDSTSVSNLFIDEYMRDANDAQIKIYLYIIRMMNAHRTTSVSDMADQFNHTEKDVVRALKYWEKQGLLSLDFTQDGVLSGIRLRELRPLHEESGENRVVSITPLLSAAQPAASSRRRSSSASASSRSKAVSAETSVPAKQTPDAEALEAFQAREGGAQLMFIIQQYIGKPLSVKEMQTVYYISEDLHFSDDLIDYLVQYCLGRGKRDFRYIEKVAVNWAESGITTPKQAEHAIAAASVSASSTSAKRGSRIAKQTNTFNQIAHNSYNFDELERQILDN